MAWQLLNRRFTVGSVDASGDITPGVAQTGFGDFSALVDGNTTYVAVVQGAQWSYMTVQRVGSILRPQTTHDSSAGGSPITFTVGVPVQVFSDLGGGKTVYIDGDGNVQNAGAILNTLAPETLAELKTTPLPASGKTVRYLRNIVAGDRKAAWYEWDPNETAAGDDFNYVVSSLSATGRWVRLKPIIEIPALASDADSYNSSLYAVSDDLRHKSSGGIVKKIPRTANYFVAKYPTLAALKAVVVNDPNGDPWNDDDEILLTGWLNDGDLDAPLKVKWDKDSTNTDSLDVTFIRPDNITGVNPGRYQIAAPVRAIKFANSDATPSVKDADVFQIADTPPALYTAFADMRDGREIVILPNATATGVFQNSASFKTPTGKDYEVKPTDAPIHALKENGVIYLIGSNASRALLASTASGEGASLVGVEDAAGVLLAENAENAITELRRSVYEYTGSGGTTADIPKRIALKENALCFYGGAVVDLADYSIDVDTPTAGQTRFTFGFTLESGVKIKIYA